jgi:putative DNA methylase
MRLLWTSVPFGVINVWVYGMSQWGDLFTARQKLALLTLAKHCRLATDTYSLAALNLSHITERNNSLCRWYPDAYVETVGTVFGRQAIPMVWDFAEAVPLVDSSGGWGHSLDFIARAVEFIGSVVTNPGQAQPADAAEHPLPDDSAHVWFTDPPYYDSVPYSYIADFFYVWLKRSLSLSSHSFMASQLSPKAQEIVAYVDESEAQEPAYERYERRMTGAFREGRRVLRQDNVGSVVFAPKTTEGWEALLSGMISAGWTITASWPIATEMASRLRARESAALATSIHLVCRARPQDAPVGEWGDVLRELPQRVGNWIKRLQGEGIRGAGLVFACIGPAMEIYSRYRRVEDAEGREIPLVGDPTASEPYKRGFLAYVWETVGRLALEQVLGTAEAQARNGGAGALEEDSRLTALFPWTLQTTETATNGEGTKDDAEADEDEDEAEKPKKKKAGFTLIYDVARRFAQPLGIHLDKGEGRIIETEKGVVRLLPVA